ncbi:hypothetical protein I4U23_027483 [Adineta vaga]|nr:hypothetical protein I4U23_027483 [Adineta vaga]
MGKLHWFYLLLLWTSLLVNASQNEEKQWQRKQVLKRQAVPAGLLPYVGAIVAPEVFLALAAAYGASVLMQYGIRTYGQQTRGAKACRCTFRNAPQELYNRGICPDRVTAVNKDNNIGICQKDAKNTAPIECRQYYGHCDWLQ